MGKSKGPVFCALAVLAFTLPAVTFLMPEQVEAEYVAVQDAYHADDSVLLIDDSDCPWDPEDDDTDVPFVIMFVDVPDIPSSLRHYGSISFHPDLVVPV